MAIQVIEYDVAVLSLLDDNHNAHTVFVGLVAQIGDARQLLIPNQSRDGFEEQRLVDAIRQFGQHNEFIAFFRRFYLRARAHCDAAATGRVSRVNAAAPHDETGGREIGTGQVFYQFVNLNVGVVQTRERGVNNFGQVVRRNIGRHTNRDTRRTVDQQVRHARRQNNGLALGIVVVRGEINGFFVQVGQQFVRDTRQTHFGVAHRRRRVAVDRTEVTLPAHQRVTQGERLNHAHYRVVDCGVAVRMIFTNNVTDDARGFFIRLVVIVFQFAHREQGATMNRLKAIANIGQGAPDNDAH